MKDVLNMGNYNSAANRSDQGSHTENQEADYSTTEAATSFVAPINLEELFDFLLSLSNDEKLERIFGLSRRLIRRTPELIQKVKEVKTTFSSHQGILKNIGSHISAIVTRVASSSTAGYAMGPATSGTSPGLAGMVAEAKSAAAMAEKKLIKSELEKVQLELRKFHDELQVLAKLNHHEPLAENVKRFGKTLIELEGLSETGFISFLEKNLEAVTKFLKDSASLPFKDVAKQLLQMTDEAKIRTFMKQYLLPHLDKSTKANLGHLISILKLVLDSVKEIYSCIKLVVYFIIPLNKEELSVDAIASGVITDRAIGGSELVLEFKTVLTKIAPQVLSELGCCYDAGDFAIVNDLCLLIDTCVTIDDVRHEKTLHSLADKPKESQPNEKPMDKMDIESNKPPMGGYHPDEEVFHVDRVMSLSSSTATRRMPFDIGKLSSASSTDWFHQIDISNVKQSEPYQPADLSLVPPRRQYYTEPPMEEQTNAWSGKCNKPKISNISREVIGRGSFGTVVYFGFLMQNYVTTRVAVKRIQLSNVKDQFIQRIDELESLLKVDIDHPNILSYLCFESDDDFLLIATELCAGTLQDWLEKKYFGPPIGDEREILFQVTQGLGHLHKLGILHRDIMPTNILISKPENRFEVPSIKVADFGLYNDVIIDHRDDTNITLKSNTIRNPLGTEGWMAPELYHFDEHDSKVDIFSLGILFYYTLTGGDHPFGKDANTQTVRIINKEIMVVVPEVLKIPYSDDLMGSELIQWMLDVEPGERPTTQEILDHDFFLKNHQKRTSSLIKMIEPKNLLFSDIQDIKTQIGLTYILGMHIKGPNQYKRYHHLGDSGDSV